MAPYKVLYKRKCRIPIDWDEVGEQKLAGLELIQQMQDVIAKINVDRNAIPTIGGKT